MANPDTTISDPTISEVAGPAMGHAGFVVQARRFIGDFAGFAGKDAVTGAALAFIGAGFESIGLVLLVPLLSVVTATGGSSGWIHNTAEHVLVLTGAQSRTAQLSVLLALFAVLIVVRAIVVARRDQTLMQLQRNFVEHIRAQIARKLAAAPWPVVARLQHARVTHMMSGDIQRIGSAALFVVQLSTSLVLTLFQIAIAILLAPALAGMAIALIAVGALANFLMIGRAHAIGAGLSRSNIALMHETTQFLGGLKLAAGQNRQTDFVNEFETSLTAVKTQQLAFIHQQAAGRRTATIITGLVGALVVFIGLTVFDTPPPILIATLLIFARISGPVMQMSQAMQQFAHTLPAYDEVIRLEGDLAATLEPSRRPAAADIAPGAIVFRNASFRYDGTRHDTGAIVDLDLSIEPGSYVGITGPSGAGKTTFADLLIGLIEPQSGEITVGGTVLRGGAAAAWRDHVSYVAQDPYLFGDTIRRNLLWASPQASEEQLWDALAVAEASALVARMQAGLDTVLGERGTLISGGERQRLCLARAVLRRPWLYVLDEATSAIDVATEQKILERIAAFHPRPTIVMIAHRDESLSNCDRVLRFEAGRYLSGRPAKPAAS
jgi:ABC-type multidrug transport system fused ATPase/permease subunit